MIPFRVIAQPGLPIYEQVLYAATRSIVAGQFRPGDPFPSVRALSREFKINPNTAHKVIAALLADGLLESRPGIGTVVTEAPSSTRSQRAALLGHQVEQLVVEAKRLSIDHEQLLRSISQHWQRLSNNSKGDPE